MKQFVRQAIAITMLVISCIWPEPDAHAGTTIEDTGTALSILLPATAAGLTLKNHDKEGSWQFAEAAALTLGVTWGLKYSIDATRPNGGEHSFPSGHSSISFVSAEFMRARYGWVYGIPAYAAATFVAYSRVESDNHHVRDVLAGAAIGMLGSAIFTSPQDSWHVRAEAGEGRYGIGLVRSW